jgi:hypothetical protein
VNERKAKKKLFFLFYNFRKSLLNSTISLNDRLLAFVAFSPGSTFIIASIGRVSSDGRCF